MEDPNKNSSAKDIESQESRRSGTSITPIKSPVIKTTRKSEIIETSIIFNPELKSNNTLTDLNSRLLKNEEPGSSSPDVSIHEEDVLEALSEIADMEAILEKAAKGEIPPDELEKIHSHVYDLIEQKSFRKSFHEPWPTEDIKIDAIEDKSADTVSNEFLAGMEDEIRTIDKPVDKVRAVGNPDNESKNIDNFDNQIEGTKKPETGIASNNNIYNEELLNNSKGNEIRETGNQEIQEVTMSAPDKESGTNGNQKNEKEVITNQEIEKVTINEPETEVKVEVIEESINKIKRRKRFNHEGGEIINWHNEVESTVGIDETRNNKVLNEAITDNGADNNEVNNNQIKVDKIIAELASSQTIMANASNCSSDSDSAFEDENNNQPRYYFRNRNKNNNVPQIKIEMVDEKASSHEEFYPDTDSVAEKSSATETSSVVVSGSYNEAHNEAHNGKKINQEVPEVNKGNGYWTNQEIQYLKNWIKQHGLKFDKILAKYNMNDQQHCILSGRNRVSIAKKVKDLRKEGEIKKQGKIRYSRTPWKEEETNALEEGIKIYGREWKKIIEDDKSKGDKSVLFKRDNVALKDKAKNEYNRRLKEKQSLGVYAIMKKRKRK